LAHDVAEIAEVALTGKTPEEREKATSSSDQPEKASRARTVAVIGGGIAGLSAAWSLVSDRQADADIIVYESSPSVGGKLRLNEIEGLSLDAGAESMLAVRPEAIALTKAVGLGSSIVNPATTSAAVYSRGELRPLPAGLISGIPTDLRALAASDILSVPGLLRIPLDHVLPKTSIPGDVSVGDYVATRMGREVVDRLVEPMLGGVYAGRAEELSLEMTVPALYRLARRERSLLAAAKEARKTGAAPSGARRGPVFAGISGGVGRLPIALAERLERRGVTIDRGTEVTGIRRTSRGWRVLTGEKGDREGRTVDAIVLAVPAPVAAKLLRKVNSAAASGLDTVGYASVALTTFLYAPEEVSARVQGSGFLVPPVEGFSVKAATFASRKWAWVARTGAVGRKRGSDKRSFMVVRASLGRFGEPGLLQRSDEELAALAAKELSHLAGLPAKPLVSRVNRWDDALPQYTVGHRGRMALVREALVDTPGLAVCGAAYDGVGIAACIGSAQFAAGQVVTYLSERGQWAHG
jgi:oxygen-dependent protoporphyrinogen oxidase